MRGLRGSTAVFVLGVLLAQASWLLAVPPFRGSDEFDHAFRAAGVAGGQWRLTTPAENGRGLLTDVPPGIVEAAHAQCASLAYTGPDNCTSVARTESGDARIATSAGEYHPAFYWVIGTAAEGFEGARALYAMRIASALLCLLGIAAAYAALNSCFSPGGPWIKLALLTALTPTLMYTTAVAAPNGIEIVAGLVLWVSLLGVGGASSSARRDRRLLTLAIVATPLLCTVRMLGPLWFGAIVFAVVVFRGVAPVWRIAQDNRCAMVMMAGAAVLSVAHSMWWVMSSSAGYGGEPGAAADTRLRRVFDLHLWVMQSVGAFPYRNDSAPIWVYPLVLLVLAAFLVVGVRRGTGTQRLGLVLAVSMTLVIPMSLTWVALQESGGSWQGRYSLPFAVGAVILGGYVLDQAGWASAEGGRLRALAWVMLAIAHVGSVVGVVRSETVREVSSSDPDWAQHAPLLIAALMLGAWVCFGISLLAKASGQPAELSTELVHR